MTQDKNPSAARKRGRLRSLPGVTDALRGIVASVEPAVVLSSLARCCASAFSDACSVELSEGVESLFRVSFPMDDDDTSAAELGSNTFGSEWPADGGKTLSTSFQGSSSLGYSSFAGVVSYFWSAHHPTEDDAIIARLLVDHAVTTVRQERLGESAARADSRAAKLTDELLTSLVVGEAIGILRVRHQATREDAMSSLRRVSRSTQRPLHDVATDVVRSERTGGLSALGADGRPRSILHSVSTCS